ncbi:hypothetical protein [Streptomyces pseudovenezuelae]|uniref:Uncharacterized protein n=1 Tax=Streptomyces pseudovenezuelae TaxID=67350 RepID=A0ABT6LGB0_9ACTN|nr:hypothetical protein [Streptomyces pseudovenezuelae]MDH6214834.1 hypothetical protein [Streptomyces pseudovenezuelae]
MRPEIWIGDVVRALEVARTEIEQAQVLELLGLTGGIPLTDPVVTPPTPPLPEPSPETAREEPDAEPDDEPPPRYDAEDRHETVDVTAELPLLQPVRIETTSPSREPVRPLARPTPERVPLPYTPLLVPGWTSAILRAMLSRQVCEGPVDIPALIDTLAHGRPVVRLPRRPVSTLRDGIQVLVDRGTGMQPFRRDQDQLVHRIRTVVGSGLVEVGYFADLPQRGTGPGARWTRTTYAPPDSGRCVLLLSDLGLGGRPDDPNRGTRPGWEEFVALVTRAGCGAVALSPYPPKRWPEWMTRLLPLVSWDRTTTAGRIKARLR